MKRSSVTINSQAKINLGLLIKGKRADGYHLLETVLYPIELADEIVVYKADESCVEMIGANYEVPLEENLAYRAWKAISDHIGGIPAVRIEITKQIPAGAGLGGGSSNAAHVALALNDLFELGLTPSELAEILKPLGADVPFFVYGKPLLAKGIGNEFEEIPSVLDGYRVELETPRIHSSTIAAYKGLKSEDYSVGFSLIDLIRLPVEDWKNRLVNDLEKPVFRMYPELAEIKQRFYERGAVYAAMSGSGSAVFGVFVS